MIKINGKEVKLIDAHTHIWNRYAGIKRGDIAAENLGYGKIRFDGKVEKLLPSVFVDNKVTFEILLGYMEDVGTDQVVVLQNPCYGDQREYVYKCMQKYPDKILATFGKLDPRKIDTVIDEIDTLVNQYSCSGIKIEVPDVPFIIDDPEYDFMWRKIVEDNLIIVFDLGFGDGEYDFNIERLTNVINRYPDIRMVLPHLGISRLWDLNQKHPYPELQKTLRLFKINKNNLYVDISAIQFFDVNDEHPDYRNQDIIKVVYESIGPDKIIWGTDFPTILNLRTIRQCLDFIVNQCDFLTDEDKIKILSQNALSAYGSNANIQ